MTTLRKWIQTEDPYLAEEHWIAILSTLLGCGMALVASVFILVGCWHQLWYETPHIMFPTIIVSIIVYFSFVILSYGLGLAFDLARRVEHAFVGWWSNNQAD